MQVARSDLQLMVFHCNFLTYFQDSTKVQDGKKTTAKISWLYIWEPAQDFPFLILKQDGEKLM